MATGADIGYQMRLDPKHTSNDAIRRLSANDINDTDKLYRSKSYISLAQPPDTSFKVKGKSLTGEDDKSQASLCLAQVKASALCVKSESESPHIVGDKSSARMRRGQTGTTPKQRQVKYDESKKLFVNKSFLKEENKLPQIKLNSKHDDAIVPKSSAKNKADVSGRDVGSWTLSYINPSLLEIDMSGFAPFGEYGYFSAYGVKGHQAFTTSEKLSSYTGSSLQSVKQHQMNEKMRNKLYKNRLSLDLDTKTTTSGLSRSNLLHEMSRSKPFNEFSNNSKFVKRTGDNKLKTVQKPESARMKMHALPEDLNLTRSKTCLVLPNDSPRGVFSKRKRSSKDLTASKGKFGSKESLTSMNSEKKITKPIMKTSSTQTRGSDESIYSSCLNDDLFPSKETSPRTDLHNQGGILYSTACFDPPSKLGGSLKGHKSSRYLDKSISQTITPRSVRETIEEDKESVSSGNPERFQIEISVTRNMYNQST